MRKEGNKKGKVIGSRLKERHVTQYMRKEMLLRIYYKQRGYSIHTMKKNTLITLEYN